MKTLMWMATGAVGCVLGVNAWCAESGSAKVDLAALGMSPDAVNREVDGKPPANATGSVFAVEANTVHTFRWAEPRERTVLVAVTEGFDRLVTPAAWQTNLAAVQESCKGYRLATGAGESIADIPTAFSKALMAAKASLAGTDAKDPMTNRIDLIEWRIVPCVKGAGVECLVGVATGGEACLPAAAAVSGPIPGWVFAPAHAMNGYKGMSSIAVGIGTGTMAHQRAMANARAEIAPGAVTSSYSDRSGLLTRSAGMRTEGIISDSRPLASWDMVFNGQYVVFILMGAPSPTPQKVAP
jgi:hypothetical protein